MLQKKFSLKQYTKNNEENLEYVANHNYVTYEFENHIILMILHDMK